MIPYVRTEWYGMGYLTRLTGSQLPHCLPWAIVSGAMGAFFASGVLDSHGWPIRDFFGDPYAMQVLGIVFGYLSITRLNVSYNRYWEGTTQVRAAAGHPSPPHTPTISLASVPHCPPPHQHPNHHLLHRTSEQVKIMHARWMAACVHLLSFDRISSPDPVLRNDPFCARRGHSLDFRHGKGRHGPRTLSAASPADPSLLRFIPAGHHLMRIFSQLSAVSIMTLHVDKYEAGTYEHEDAEGSPRASGGDSAGSGDGNHGDGHRHTDRGGHRRTMPHLEEKSVVDEVLTSALHPHESPKSHWDFDGHLTHPSRS